MDIYERSEMSKDELKDYYWSAWFSGLQVGIVVTAVLLAIVRAAG